MTKKLILFTIAFVMIFTSVFLNDTSIAAAASPEIPQETVPEMTPVAPPETTPEMAPETKPEPAPEKAPEIASVKSIKASLYASNIVKLSWTKRANVSGYIIYEKRDGKFVQIKTIRSPKVSSVKIKKVKKGVAHRYSIKSYKRIDGQAFYSDRTEAAKIFVPKVMSKRTKGFKNTTAFKLIKTAEKKIGSRYVSGAQGPSQFDCSGYVYYITKTADVSTKKITRTSSASMWSNLKKHSIGTTKLSKAQPGDIVFLSASPQGRISHVAFYYGDDQYIHATSPGVGVAVTPTRHYGHVQGIVRLPNM